MIRRRWDICRRIGAIATMRGLIVRPGYTFRDVAAKISVVGA